jgi:hypothetical protein
MRLVISPATEVSQHSNTPGEETTSDDSDHAGSGLEDNESENAGDGNDTALVVRGNGELIEETLVVDEDTETVDPEGVIMPEDNHDDEISQRMEDDLDEDEKEIKPD